MVRQTVLMAEAEHSQDNSENSPAGGNVADEPPLTAALLADLQAGLLDNDAAARVRSRVRADPAAEALLHALDRVRADVAALGADPASAPEVPAAVTARIGATLRTQTSARWAPTHAVRSTGRPARMFGVAAGLAAAAAAFGVGTVTLLGDPNPTTSTLPTAEHITVAPPAAVIGLAAPQILDLLHRPPDYGLLADPQRRASCLSGLGYPASAPALGAQPVDVDGRIGVLLLLAGDTPDTLVAVAVAPNCSSADAGVLTKTVVNRP